MPAKKTKIIAKIGGVIADGKGGTFDKGEELPKIDAEIIEALKARGLI